MNSFSNTIIVNIFIFIILFRQSFVAAFQMRTAIASAIYRKTLTISNSARKDFSTGEITNLMSIDAQRFVEIVPYLNTVWSS